MPERHVMTEIQPAEMVAAPHVQLKQDIHVHLPLLLFELTSVEMDTTTQPQ